LLGYPQRVISLEFVFILLSDGVGMAFDTETGEEIDAFNVNTLLLDGFGSK